MRHLKCDCVTIGQSLEVGEFPLLLAGYVNSRTPLTPELLERMKWLMMDVQFVGVSIAAAMRWFFPVSRARRKNPAIARYKKK